jgi:hypothetical protein
MAPHDPDGHASVHYCASNGKRHPREMGAAAVERFLSWLAVERRVLPRERRTRRSRRCCFFTGRCLDDDFAPFLTLQAYQAIS